eukprot:31035-Pelagococcus_subviridis.AAC.4
MTKNEFAVLRRFVSTTDFKRGLLKTRRGTLDLERRMFSNSSGRDSNLSSTLHMLFVFIRSFNGAIKRSIFRGHATPGLVIGAVKDKKGSRKTRELVNNSEDIARSGVQEFFS